MGKKPNLPEYNQEDRIDSSSHFGKTTDLNNAETAAGKSTTVESAFHTPHAHSLPPDPTPTNASDESWIIKDVKIIEGLAHFLFISNFLRGLFYFYQAYKAIKNKDEPQRATKIATGIFGGLVSIGAGLVGSFLVFSVGVLGTATAAFFGPIAIAAAVSGIYGATLYRDSYSYSETTKKIKDIERKLKTHPEDPTLKRELASLNTQKKELKISIAINVVCTLTMGFAIGAILSTGIGAFVLGAFAAAFTAATIGARIYYKYQSRKLAAQSRPATPTLAPTDDNKLDSAPSLVSDNKLTASKVAPEAPLSRPSRTYSAPTTTREISAHNETEIEKRLQYFRNDNSNKDEKSIIAQTKIAVESLREQDQIIEQLSPTQKPPELKATSPKIPSHEIEATDTDTESKGEGDERHPKLK